MAGATLGNTCAVVARVRDSTSGDWVVWLTREPAPVRAMNSTGIRSTKLNEPAVEPVPVVAE